jgi:preprotein translocase subunit SecA
MQAALAAVLPERPAPGPFWGDYPQRDEARMRGPLQAWLGRLRALDGRRGDARARAVLARADALERSGSPLAALAASLRARLRSGRARAVDRTEALALACVAARTVLGLSPFATQVRAAAVMLDDGLAELATGEGKTLALALAAAARGLAGVPVHVITINDYLVARDCARLAPFFRALGLACDRVLAADDPARRRLGWSRDVVYCTAHELMFDWLRDRLAGADRGGLGALAASLAAPGPVRAAPPLLRGLCSAFVDEADGLLIDNATLPCVLAQSGEDPADGLAEALRIAGLLWQGRDWRPDAGTRVAALTEAGRERIARESAGLDGPWRLARRREGLVAQALAALHLYRAERDYLVRDGRVEIVDAATGRIAVGRAWSAGLHQMIEHKERAAGTLPHQPVIQVSPARCFPRYWRLGGLSATLAEEAGELARRYGTAVVRIAPRQPSRRTDLPPRVFATPAARDAALIARVDALSRAGRPVLVAVRDLAESRALGEAMRRSGLAPATIDARHADDEAHTVAAAGACGRVTLVTDMAGRGTDIVLEPAAVAAGGLALVATFVHASRRLERQLQGRVARRGEPGSAEAWLLAGDPVPGATDPASRSPFVGRLLTGVPAGVVLVTLRAVQQREASRARRLRMRLVEAARARACRDLIGRTED